MIRHALLALLLATPALAQSSGDAARTAMAQLEAASVQLQNAQSSRDRVGALTETIVAFEDGLAAIRDGLRAASIRETELRRKLASDDKEIANLLAALSTLGGSAQPQSMAHPQGAIGAARAGMLLASVTPGLAHAANEIRADLEEATFLRQLQQDAADTLQTGLVGVQTARTDLSKAVADRTDLPRKFIEDPVKTALLIAASETLDGFASGLSHIAEGEEDLSLPGVSATKGTLPLPVAGEILRRAGETDAAGVQRPGILIATRPQAIVRTPATGTIRYRGPLLDYGLVTILEPESDILLVFAGLGAIYGETGQVLAEGAPLGLMGGNAPTGENPSPSGERGGNDLSETLYIEVRQGDAPEDPLAWFAEQ